MRALPYAVVIVVGIVVTVLLVVAGTRMVQAGARRRRERREAERLHRARLETPWASYCRPDEAGVWRYGVERVCALDDRSVALDMAYEMGTLPAGFVADERLAAEGDALIEAGRRNAARVGMQ